MSRAATEGGAGSEPASLVDHVRLETLFQEFKAQTQASLAAGNVKFAQVDAKIAPAPPDYKWLAGLSVTIVGFIIAAMLLLQEYPKKTEVISETVEISSELKERIDKAVTRIESRHKLDVERLEKQIGDLKKQIDAVKKTGRRR